MRISFRQSKIERDPDTIQLWKDKYVKVEKENVKLRSELDAIQQYKDDYEDLIAQVKIIKKRYEYLIEKEEELYNDYKEELDKVLGIAKIDI